MIKTASIVAVLLRWRYLLSAVMIGFSVWLATGIGALGWAVDFRLFFDEDHPVRISYENLEREFTQSYTLLFIVEAESGDLFTAQRLQAIEDVTAAAWRLPHVSRVISLANHQHTTAEGDELWVEDLLDEPARFSDADIARTRRIALAEPELVGRLISADGTVATVTAYLSLTSEQDAEKGPLLIESRELAAELGARYPGLRIRIAGQLAVDAALIEIAEADSARVESLMFLALMLLTGFLLRSWIAVVGVLSVIMLSAVAATGFIGFFYGSFNGINVSTPYIVLLMAVLDCVHILSAYFARLNAGDHKHEAMRHSLHKNLEALVITSITTAAGFLAMNFADSPPFRQFGTATAFGVMVALVVSVTVLPAIVLLFPARAPGKPPVAGIVRWVQTAFASHSRLYLPLGLLLMAVMLPLALTNKPENHALDAFKKDSPVRVATEFLDEHLAGSDLLDFMLGAGAPGEIVDPDFLRSVDRFSRWLEQQPEVNKVAGFHSVIKRLNRTMHADLPDFYAIPDDRRAAAEYLLIYESSVPEELDLQDSINIDKSALRLNVMLRRLSSSEMLEFRERALNRLQAAHPEVKSVNASSPTFMFAYMGQTNIYSLLEGCLYVALFVCVTMMIAFRSVWLGLLCMIPNLMPVIVAFGLCGLFIGVVDFGTAMLFAMTLGVVVDDTVHFVVGYRRFRVEQGMSQAAAVHETFSLAGRAIIITSLVLCVGYAIPAIFAELQMNVQMYTLSIVVFFTALIADLFFLPALLVKTDRL